MVKKFDEYVIESATNELISLINGRINEELEFDEAKIREKLEEFIEFAFSKGKEYAIPVIKAFWEVVNWNKKVSYTLFAILIFMTGMKVDEVIKSFARNQEDAELIRRAGMGDSDEDRYRGWGIETDEGEVLYDEEPKETEEKGKLVLNKGNLVDFLNSISKRESSHDPGVVNSAGYIGLYQFGKGALKDLEIYRNKKWKIVLTSRDFLRNPNLFPVEEQNKAMLRYLRINKGYLKDEIKEFVGKKIGGILITESGLLAGSHLLGHGGIKRFLRSGGRIIDKDGNGTPITEYIKKFGGYDLKDLDTKSLSSVENINPVWKKGSKFKSWRKIGKAESPNK